MILLDTNVVSEPLRLSGDPAVVAWIDAQNVETLYLAAISLAELRFGVAALPSGKRKDTLHRNLERRVVPLFTGRILPFDAAASEAYAEIMALARAEGKAIGKADGYIAATAAVNGLIGTRGKTPGKLKPLIQWAKPRSRILSMLGLCRYQIRLYRLGKTRF